MNLNIKKLQSILDGSETNKNAKYIIYYLCLYKNVKYKAYQINFPESYTWVIK